MVTNNVKPWLHVRFRCDYGSNGLRLLYDQNIMSILCKVTNTRKSKHMTVGRYGPFIRDAHGYPDIRINPDNKLSGYIRIINYPFN